MLGASPGTACGTCVSVLLTLSTQLLALSALFPPPQLLAQRREELRGQGSRQLDQEAQELEGEGEWGTGHWHLQSGEAVGQTSAMSLSLQTALGTELCFSDLINSQFKTC